MGLFCVNELQAFDEYTLTYDIVLVTLASWLTHLPAAGAPQAV